MLQNFLDWINAPFDLNKISPKTIFLFYGLLILVALLWHMILRLIVEGGRTISEAA